jgi:hypothetical protein
MKITVKISKAEMVTMIKSHSRQTPVKGTRTIIDKKTKMKSDRKAWRKDI